MNIVMTQTLPGSRNGIDIESFEAGTTYDLTDAPDLASSFVTIGAARPVVGPAETKVDGPSETQADKPQRPGRAPRPAPEEK